jgi:hypothetical protein
MTRCLIMEIYWVSKIKMQTMLNSVQHAALNKCRESADYGPESLT